MKLAFPSVISICGFPVEILTYTYVFPVLDHVFAHGLEQVPVFLGVGEVLLVVGGLQHQVGDVHHAHHSTAVPVNTRQIYIDTATNT